jgi:hypothetical protein
MKRIVLFGEGEGEVEALPRLVGRLLDEQKAWDAVIPDPDPFRVGQVNKLLKDGCREWKRKLGAALKRSNVGGVLLVLDGDDKRSGGNEFCAAETAKSLAQKATEAGAGSTFSVAVVFARQEFESWLIGGFGSLAGKRLPDGRRIPATVTLPDGDLEQSPRNAKGWLNHQIEGGYRPTRDQVELTKMVDLAEIRTRNLRSFLRLESAVSELVSAIRNGEYVVTPSGS